MGAGQDKKRLELLELKTAQLNAMHQGDVALQRQIEELREKVRAYEAPPVSEELPKGVVRLGRKTEDGRVVPVSGASAGPAE